MNRASAIRGINYRFCRYHQNRYGKPLSLSSKLGTAYRLHCHCEERSDEAIQEKSLLASVSGLFRFARNRPVPKRLPKRALKVDNATGKIESQKKSPASVAALL